MLVLLAVFSFLLLAGSLFPWRFVAGPSLAAAVVHLLHTWDQAVAQSSRGDILVNLIIYIPVGFTGYLWPGWRTRTARVVAPLAAGALLSFTVETLQHYFPPRAPGLIDLVCNVASTALGIAVAAVFHAALESRYIQWRRRHSIHPSSALLLLALWAAALGWPLHAYPLGIVGRVRELLHAQPWQWMEFFAGALPWLLAGSLLSAVAGPRPARWQLPALLPVLLLVQLVSPGHGLTWAYAAGAVLATALYCSLPEHKPGFAEVLACLWLAWVVMDGLRPFTMAARPHAFGWVPFEDLIGSEWMGSISVLLRKTWSYGALFWLLAHTRAGRRLALALTLLTLTAIEIAQRWLPGRTPSLTDVAIALLAVALLWLVDLRFVDRPAAAGMLDSWS